MLLSRWSDCQQVTCPLTSLVHSQGSDLVPPRSIAKPPRVSRHWLTSPLICCRASSPMNRKFQTVRSISLLLNLSNFVKKWDLHLVSPVMPHGSNLVLCRIPVLRLSMNWVDFNRSVEFTSLALKSTPSAIWISASMSPCGAILAISIRALANVSCRLDFPT